MRETYVRLHQEAYLRLDPPHSSAHLIVVERGGEAAAET
jgi:hypothetical protein